VVRRAGVLCPVLAVSPALLNKFKRGYLDPSLRGALGARRGLGSASDLGLRELDGGGVGMSS
jgi:hypothetical protein